MYQLINIEEERSKLWLRLYYSLREILYAISKNDCPFEDALLPYPVASLYVDIDNNIVINLYDGQSLLIEELEDTTMISIYECVTNRTLKPS